MTEPREIRASRLVLVDDQNRERIVLDATDVVASVKVINPATGDYVHISAGDSADEGVDVAWYRGGDFAAGIGTTATGVVDVWNDEAYEARHRPIEWRAITPDAPCSCGYRWAANHDRLLRCLRSAEPRDVMDLIDDGRTFYETYEDDDPKVIHPRDWRLFLEMHTDQLPDPALAEEALMSAIEGLRYYLGSRMLTRSQTDELPPWCHIEWAG